MLTMPISGEWFRLIAAGVKTEEYRQIKPYWDARFRNVFDMDATGEPTGVDEHPILFRNGYSRDSPSLIALCTLSKGVGRPEWGAKPGERYWILRVRHVERADGRHDNQYK